MIPLPPKPLPGRTRRLIAQARALMVWERYAPAYLFAAAAVMVFVAGAWAGVWERIGDPWRGLALIAALAVLAWTIWKARHLDLPSRSDAKRRLESDNGLRHRPLDTLEDSPVITERGWLAHYRRAEAEAGHIGTPSLRPALADRDPYFLRYAAPLLLVAAFFVGVGDNSERLRRALSPSWQAAVNPSDATFEAWIDPPDYTGRRPVTLKGDTLDDVPEGSEFVARISGIRSLPRLKLETDGGTQRLSATRIGPESFEVRTILQDDAVARLRLGSRRQAWELGIVYDEPPMAAFTDTPEADKRDRLALTYDLSDDYGVETLQLELRPLVDEGEPVPETELIDIPLRGAPVTSAEAASQPIDLSRHRWAGRKAVGQLVATDGAGQQAISTTAYFRVPDKIFVEPLAKAVIEQRALVMEGLHGDAEYAPPGERDPDAYFDTWEPQRRLARAPAEVQRAARLIDAVTDMPEDSFDDPALYMGLRNVASQLRYARKTEAIAGLDDELWSLALRAEFGRLGTALEDMRRAQEALNSAIARRAPQREVDVLFDRYNEAVDRYVEALSEDAEPADASADAPPPGQNRSVDEIQELLDAIEEANRIGDTEGARLALARLAELLENMKIQQAQGGGGSGSGQPQPGGEMSEEMRESLEDLAELLGEQRDLKDDTEQAESGEQESGESGAEDGDQQGQQDGREEGRQGSQQEEGRQGSQQDGQQQGRQQNGAGGLAERQQDLAEGLGGLQQLLPEGETQGLGENGEEAAAALEDADDAMRRAAEALRNGELGAAQDAQDDAIAELRRAGRSLAEGLADRNEERGEDEGQSADGNPLGQQNGGSPDGTEEQDLSQTPAERSREILEELRRRAAEQERSAEEREYLERLMKRF